MVAQLSHAVAMKVELVVRRRARWRNL